MKLALKTNVLNNRNLESHEWSRQRWIFARLQNSNWRHSQWKVPGKWSQEKAGWIYPFNLGPLQDDLDGSVCMLKARVCVTDWLVDSYDTSVQVCELETSLRNAHIFISPWSSYQESLNTRWLFSISHWCGSKLGQCKIRWAEKQASISPRGFSQEEKSWSLNGLSMVSSNHQRASYGIYEQT